MSKGTGGRMVTAKDKQYVYSEPEGEPVNPVQEGFSKVMSAARMSRITELSHSFAEVAHATSELRMVEAMNRGEAYDLIGAYLKEFGNVFRTKS